jgi:hypothetical protein
MEIENITDSTPIKSSFKGFLLGNIDRRTFLHRLTALGVKLAQPDRQVIALLGDGAFLGRRPEPVDGQALPYSYHHRGREQWCL